ACVEVAAAEREEPLECVRVRRSELGSLAEPRGEGLHLPLRGADAGAAREVVTYRLTGASVVLLRQEADRSRPGHRSAIGLLLAREDAEERRLADAVRADDPDPVAGRHDERHAVEHLRGG